jgi:carboxylesterase
MEQPAFGSARLSLAMNFLPGAEPFTLGSGGSAGVLLLHGFSGSVSEIRALGHDLHAAGFGVVAPTLAGHGTTPQDLTRITRDDFLTSAEDAFRTAAERFARVYVVGLSMGGTLGLHLAARHDVSALVTVSAPVFMGRLVSLSVPIAMRWAPRRNVISNYAAWRGEVVGYKTTPLSSLGAFLDVLKIVRRELPRVDTPLLIIHSTGDQTVPAGNAQFIAAHVKSRVKHVRMYQGGRHLLTLPPHLPRVSNDVVEFLRAREANSVAPAAAPTKGGSG